MINLPGTTPLTVQFGGADSLGGYLNKQGQFVQYIPGVTKLPV